MQVVDVFDSSRLLLLQQKKIVFCILLILLAYLGQAQPPLSYSVTRTTANVYQSISALPNGDGTGTLSSAGGDEGTQTITFPSGFTFSYQGSPCSGFTIHANGYISLRNTLYTPSLGNSWDNTLAGSGNGVTNSAKRNIVAPFYDDLDKASPVIYYKFSGTRAVIEWSNTTFYNLTGPQIYFQIVLDGSDNSIQFNYGNMQLFNGTRNIRYSYTCGLSGAVVNADPVAGQVLQQQYENTTYFSHENATSANWGANGLCISPEPRSSIKFTPGTYTPIGPPSNTPPANDEVSGVVTGGIYDLPSLTAFPNNIAWNNTTNTSNIFTTRNATHSSQSICGGSATAKDVWFKFYANNPDMTVRVYASAGFIPRVQVLDSTLKPLPSPVCVAGSQGLIANAPLTNLVIGSYYYIRVYHDLTGTTATAVATITDGVVSGLTITSGTNYSVPATAYDYIPNNQGPIITFTGGGGNGAVAALTNPTSPTQVLSTMGSGNISFVGGKGYTSPPTVKIESPDWGITGEFAIIVYAKSANDDCTEAVSLTDLTTPGCNLQTNSRDGNTLPATPSTEAVVCGVPDDDVWYKFTAVFTKTSVTVSGKNSFDPAFQVFNGGATPGNCGTKTSLQCLNSTGAGGAERVVLTTIIGNTYFIRVYHAGTAGLVVGSGFNICASSALPSCISAPPISPSDGGNACTGSVLLKWRKADDATGYLVYLDAGTGTPATLITTKISNSDTSFTTAVLPSGNYVWRVVPDNGVGQPSGCPIWHFSNFQLPAVSISSSPSGPQCLSKSVTFTATATNVGTVAKYQWTKNGVNIDSAKAQIYTTNALVNNDVIRVVLTTNTICDTTISATSNAIVQIRNTPITRDTSLSVCNGSVTYQGITYNSSIIIRDTIRSVQGCDSIYKVATINVTNIPPLAPPSNLIPVNNRTGLNIPITFSWGVVSNAFLYDFYLWKSTDPVPTTPMVANLSQINFTYNGSLLYGTEYKWKVVAKHDACSSVSAVQTFTTRFLPDLIVNSITVPATGFSGQSFTVNWQIKNIGTGATLNQQWIDIVYISKDAILDPATDINLGSVSNPSELVPNQSYSQTATFTLPQGISDNYYVFVVTNYYNQLQETNVANNTGISTTTSAIQLTPPPDLRVTTIVPPNFAFSGQTINYNWTVANIGTGQTVAANWSDAVYLSSRSDSNLTGAVSLGTFIHTGALNAGANYITSKSATLPQGISGKYYLYVITDVYNQVYEHALENNNLSRSDSITITLTPPADLIVAQITLPVSASNRENVSIGWRIENQGGSPTGSTSWIDNVYISRAAVYHPDSVLLLGSFSRPLPLDLGEGYNTQQTVTVPSNISGLYYVYVKTDAGNTVYENVYENNNISRSSQRLNIISPDIIVSKIIAPSSDSSGKTINISWAVKNTGPGVVYNTGLTDSIFMSLSSIYNPANNIKLKVQSYNSGMLATGDSIVNTASVRLPDGISGNYYIYVHTDYTNALYENDKDNNNISRNTSPIAIVLSSAPDLQVTNVTIVQDTATAGDVIPLSFKVVNNGPRATRDSVWTDNLYLSLSAQFDSSNAIFIRSFTHNGFLAKDSSYQVNSSIQILGNIGAATYYVYLFTDALHNVYEHTNESNNIKKGDSIYIKKYPPVDLAITGLTAPASASSGNPILITWTVENKGVASTLQTQWKDGLYLSTDTVFNSSDAFISDVTHNGVLAPGVTYTMQNSFVLPNGISGRYYLLLVADHTNITNDINRKNNYKLIKTTGDSSGIVIALTPPPDLTVTSLTVPDRGPAGQPVTVIFKIKNNGPGVIAAGASWTEKFYLSTNTVLDAGDAVIGSYTKSGPLNAGEEYTQSIQVFLPISASGNYVVFIKTDANDNIYEHTAEQNNTRYEPITVEMQLLSDLIVSGFQIPAEAIAGDSVTIKWKIKNIGLNPATGYMKDAVYLSTDTSKSVNDALLTSSQTYINIAPQAEITRTFTGELAGVALNDYHVLVHTDVLNNIYETSDSNNISASPEKLKVTVRQLLINVLTVRSMTDNKEVYYRIEIPDSLAGETLLITLKADSANGNNEMYLRFGETPTRAVFDFSHSLPHEGNQEILVPSLQKGTYYLMIYGNTSAGNIQSITLLAKILKFEIRSVNASKGGNTGEVTLQIRGSKLGNVTGLRLTSNSGVISAGNVLIKDPTNLFATFNLAGAKLGIYDVVAQNAAGDTAVLKNGFTIVAGNAGGLETNVIAPPNTRPSNVISMTIEFTNTGNTDLINPVLKMTSLAGAPIAFSVTDLSKNEKELTLVMQELNGPVGRLRPGASGSIIVYAKALTSLSFMLLKD